MDGVEYVPAVDEATRLMQVDANTMTNQMRVEDIDIRMAEIESDDFQLFREVDRRETV